MKSLEEIKEVYAQQLNKTVKEFDEYDVHICNVTWHMIKIAVNNTLQEAANKATARLGTKHTLVAGHGNFNVEPVAIVNKESILSLQIKDQ